MRAAALVLASALQNAGRGKPLWPRGTLEKCLEVELAIKFFVNPTLDARNFREQVKRCASFHLLTD
jgi:hypothetical protein